MPRLLILVLALIVACDDTEPTRKTPVPDAKKVKAEPVAPTTGISKIQRGHDEIKKQIEKVEQQLDAGKKPRTALVDQQIQIVDTLIHAAEMAMNIQASETLKLSHAQLRLQQSKLQKERTDLHTRMREIREILAAHKNGKKLPEGFTETELNDNLADCAKRDKKLAEEHEKLRAEMGKKEALLAAGQQGQTPEESLFARELEALQETKKQVEAIRARLN